MGINNFTEYKKRIQMKLPCNFDAKVGFAENARVILPTKNLSIRKMALAPCIVQKNPQYLEN